jgi:hypothetical protein
MEPAKRFGSSQSRVAKIEASNPGAAADLLLRALLATGAMRKDNAAALAPSKRRPTG